MTRFLKFLSLALAGFLVVVMIVGYSLPKEYSITIKAKFNQPIERVWDTVANFKDAPKWNSFLKSAERLEDRDGNEVWQENYDGNVFILETVSIEPMKKISRKVLNSDLPYKAVWTFELEPTAGGTILYIREDAYVESAIGRFVGKLVVGHAVAISGFMLTYGKRFKENLNVELVEQKNAH